MFLANQNLIILKKIVLGFLSLLDPYYVEEIRWPRIYCITKERLRVYP